MLQFKFKINEDEDMISRYIRHLNQSLTEFTYCGYERDSKNKIEIELSLPVGKTMFVYNNIPMTFIIIESSTIHSTSYDLQKYYEYFLEFLCDCGENAKKI